MATDSRPSFSLSVERIERTIRLFRGERVILDADLAALYGVGTKVLNQAVKRNRDRFPADFMFQLTKEEFEHLRSQTVTSSWGGRRRPPYAFTEHGVAMLSSVLNSPRAVQVNIEIVRAFVRLRQVLASHKDLARKFAALEAKYDSQFKAVFDAIRQLMTPAAESPPGLDWVSSQRIKPDVAVSPARVARRVLLEKINLLLGSESHSGRVTFDMTR